MNTLIVFILGVLAGVFLINTYTSSPGFVTQEAAAEFEANKQTCKGFSYVLNKEEVAADAPGKSLCIGLLK